MDTAVPDAGVTLQKSDRCQAPILVVAAMRQELSGFKADGKAAALVTGMGTHRARRAVAEWLARNPCAGVIATGFAGATDATLLAGDLIVADEVMDEPSGKRWYPSMPLPRAGDFPVHRGRLVTLERVAWTKGAKIALGRRFQSLGVDLETAAVADTAQEAGIPWMAVRVVLDPMEELLLSPRLFHRMRIASGRLTTYLSSLVCAHPCSSGLQ